MKNIKLLIEYDGSEYSGWQRQKNAISIQQVIEGAVEQLTGKSSEVTGCSRTDAGVHARGYVANFKTDSSIPSNKFREALNSKLPQDIVILKSEEADLDFHARYSCKGKTYSYTILNRIQPPAIYRKYEYHVKDKLDVENMKKACEFFIGTHDFAAFKNTGSSVKTSVRTITALEVIKIDDKIKIFVSADGFLYNMVRIIVGTLMEVGTSKKEPECIKKIILSKDRKMSGKSVPACGLCLEEVFYLY